MDFRKNPRRFDMKAKANGTILLICLAALRLGALEGPADQSRKAGYILLDTYVRSFQEIAAQGSGATLDSRLQAMAADAKRAKDAGEINLVFYSRFARLLAMTKLLIKPDVGNILMPVIDREVRDFLLDVTGEEPLAYKAGGAGAIGQVANAIAEELINLQIYLDTLEKRQALRKKLDEGMTGPPKK
jgi:hypothetical protein